MPHTKSAKKNLRKSEKRRVRNRGAKRTIKTHLKRFQTALEGPIDVLQKEYNLAAKKLDKAAARRIIHPNLAARKKSQMARAMRTKATAGTTPTTPPAAGS
jgi:small subunit ribosomal protein S20